MGTTAIITVTTETPRERLHPDDLEVAGIYGVVMGTDIGQYPEEPRGAVEEGEDPRKDAALDVLHDHVAIAVIDDFEVEVSIHATDDDLPEDVAWL